jgi:hypothetical protein
VAALARRLEREELGIEARQLPHVSSQSSHYCGGFAA